MSPKSWPAENTFPFAAITTPRASVVPISSSTAVSSRITSMASALRFSGRSRVTVVMSPSRLTARCWRSSMGPAWRPGQRPARAATTGANCSASRMT